MEGQAAMPMTPEARRELRRLNKAAGICIYCGARLASETMCPRHLQAANESSLRRKLRAA